MHPLRNKMDDRQQILKERRLPGICTKITNVYVPVWSNALHHFIVYFFSNLSFNLVLLSGHVEIWKHITTFSHTLSLIHIPSDPLLSDLHPIRSNFYLDDIFPRVHICLQMSSYLFHLHSFLYPLSLPYTLLISYFLSFSLLSFSLYLSLFISISLSLSPTLSFLFSSIDLHFSQGTMRQS